MDLQQQITKVVMSVSTQDGAEPAAEDALFETGVLDSFALTDLVAALEKEFNVEIPDADLRPKNFSSVAQIERYINAQGK